MPWSGDPSGANQFSLSCRDGCVKYERIFSAAFRQGAWNSSTKSVYGVSRGSSAVPSRVDRARRVHAFGVEILSC